MSGQRPPRLTDTSLHEVLRLLEAGERMPPACGLAERLPEGFRDDGEPSAVLAEALLALVRTAGSAAVISPHRDAATPGPGPTPDPAPPGPVPARAGRPIAVSW
ncbi:hypothetical protein ACFWG0_03630 [Streptomyces yangpuensis]|uniref:hypothetical protein n=1 Tax=Streptomyces yangpuensis TaxID=1648182 RepID=UPI00365654DD